MTNSDPVLITISASLPVADPRRRAVAGFHRSCVIDQVLESSPAEYVRRPHVPAESPTTRRLHHLAATAGISLARMHPHLLRHTFVTTMLDAGVSGT